MLLYALSICTLWSLLHPASAASADLGPLGDLPDLPSGGLDRIIGGGTTSISSLPFMVWISKVSYASNCAGGVLLFSEWVLTAASCVYGARSNPSVVRFCAGAEGDRAKLCEGQERRASKIVVHARYQPTGFKDNVALVRLSSPFVLNSRVGIARLHTAYALPIGTRLLISGWGPTGAGNTAPASSVLKWGVVQTVNPAACDPHSPAGSIECAEGLYGVRVCPGDAGSFLGARNTAGQPVVVGVASFAETGCNGPAGFASVDYYEDFILSTTRRT